MLNFARWKIILCAVAVVLGVAFALPNMLPDSVLANVPTWLPHEKLSLGLDLQGGSYLLEQVDTDALKTEKLTNLVEDTRSSLRNAKIVSNPPVLANGQVTVRITDPTQVQAALQELGKLAVPVGNGAAREVQVVAGPDQTIVLTIPDRAMAIDTAEAVTQDIEIVRKRIDSLGTREPSISPQGTDRIVIEAPGESDPEKLKAVIGATAKLTFQMVDDTVTAQQIATGEIPPDDVVLPYADGSEMPPTAVKRQVVVSGEMLTEASQSSDRNGQPAISFRFNGVGTKKFGDTTLQNVGKPFAIIIDNKILSAPRIDEPILAGTGIISGSFTAESAHNLALELRSGALPAPLKAIEQRTVGAELGSDSVRSGAIAGLIAIAAVAAFMFLAYGFVFGGIAIVVLIANMAIVMGAMSPNPIFGGVTLTLPGIAGLILTIAMAVDANVLIFERIRDEERAGRKPIMAIDTGFSRATESILDANITTFISALILFLFAGGGGPVKGFALCLMIGVCASVFSALFITRALVVWWFNITRAKQLPI